MPPARLQSNLLPPFDFTDHTRLLPTSPSRSFISVTTRRYSGSTIPGPIQVPANALISWSTDRGTTRSGFTLCGYPSSTLFSCDFMGNTNADFCGMSMGGRWQTAVGQTPSANTGASGFSLVVLLEVSGQLLVAVFLSSGVEGPITGQRSGFDRYAYTEASSSSLSLVSTLASADIRYSVGGYVDFWYHMYVESIHQSPPFLFGPASTCTLGSISTRPYPLPTFPEYYESRGHATILPFAHLDVSR